MILPRITALDEWLVARKALLAKEKELTRQRDALTAERRKLPMVKIEKQYVLDGPQGRAKLRDLFGNHSQLVIYHFMFEPTWEEACPGCSHVMDNLAGCVVHLGARDTSFAAVSRLPLAKLAAFKKRMGWNFPWLSSFDNDFNYDFHVTLDAAKGSVEHNYASSAELSKAGKIQRPKGEMPGTSVFLRDGDNIYHTYLLYQRALICSSTRILAST